MKAVIDRFEGDFAVIEINDGNDFINMNRSALPDNAKEGSVLDVVLDANGKIDAIKLDKDETARRAENIADLMKRVFKK